MAEETGTRRGGNKVIRSARKENEKNKNSCNSDEFYLRLEMALRLLC